jgi:hypothetical protein
VKWATWTNIGVDRMGCAWLIQRFIDDDPEFLFIPTGEAVPEDAEAYDLPNVRLSHRKGHCSFHTMIQEYELTDPLLKKIARMVDEADTVQEAFLEPVAPGLDFICRGIQLTSDDDFIAMERGNLIFDALYEKLANEEQQK